MNCFVIMPFATDYDDVYSIIKQTVEEATSEQSGRCLRLDENRPAGRITDRLIGELSSASFCIADITGANPNVMWELGFAMALGKPAIIITQELKNLPFDIKDMQTIEYQRNQLAASLSRPLRRVIFDTLNLKRTAKDYSIPAIQKDETIGLLLNEVGDLKNLISELVGTWKTMDSLGSTNRGENELASMAGHWINTESGSHAYSRLIRGELITPYCFMGNDHLAGIYFGWRRIGDYWFARYKWVDDDISGFTFLKRESSEKLDGAWWSSEHEIMDREAPPKYSGVPSKWHRQPDEFTPDWAEELFNKIKKEGLASYFERHGPTHKK